MGGSYGGGGHIIQNPLLGLLELFAGEVPTIEELGELAQTLDGLGHGPMLHQVKRSGVGCARSRCPTEPHGKQKALHELIFGMHGPGLLPECASKLTLGDEPRTYDLDHAQPAHDQISTRTIRGVSVPGIGAVVLGLTDGQELCVGCQPIATCQPIAQASARLKALF